MIDQADYSQYACPYAHVEKECGHELHGPEGYENTYGIWCACGFRGPVFCLDPKELGLVLIHKRTLCEIHPDGEWPTPEQCGEMCVNWGSDDCLKEADDTALPLCRYQEHRHVFGKGSITACTKFEDPHIGGPCDNRCVQWVPPENDADGDNV